MRPHSVLLCGRFYMLLLLVTVARGSKVPGAAYSPFQSALTNHLLKWRTIGPVKIYAQNCLQAPAE